MIEKINKFILKIEEFLLGYIIIIMAVLLVINVFCRSVLNNSLSFAEELGGFLMVIVTFLGISTAARFYKHINMNAIVDNAPRAVKKVMAIVISGFTTVVTSWLTYVFIRYALDNAKVSRISTALELPMWILVAIVALGMFLVAVQYLICFIKNITQRDIYMGSHVKCGEGMEMIYEVEYKEFENKELEANSETENKVENKEVDAP
ncbi:ectoine TRAP transporter small permease protein TeaB [Anaerotignum neopropionicum]|uniref:Ectoine TRAP transporter small permease protein TeaB n=1 Tax=Anaerotignum neopropionicum TaxID=36847 RepID=A0A136WEN8_9FIRM|nr:TRAP transporter small permease [Anaerotignum neopropionicum]KXL52986.1 ectoine TRAP transporter small permease protein TeaB [Anaerotignum neopropionicum]